MTKSGHDPDHASAVALPPLPAAWSQRGEAARISWPAALRILRFAIQESALMLETPIFVGLILLAIVLVLWWVYR